ncbi:MAG: hypothetical protein QOE90_3620 [Thermoplasmata archaeon]|nr:hypothetical protein [Thermoplasmata archaeon]
MFQVNPMVDDANDETYAPRTDLVVDEERAGVLAKALEDRFDMATDDAAEIAHVVVEQFGAAAEVNDETLDPSVRSIFYTLEAKKILSFRREEYVWENGEKRRGFWWRIRDDALATARSIPILDAEEDVYASLPKDAWTARQHA